MVEGSNLPANPYAFCYRKTFQNTTVAPHLMQSPIICMASSRAILRACQQKILTRLKIEFTASDVTK